MLARHPRGVSLYDLAEMLHVAPRTMRRYLKEVEREFELSPVRPKGGGPALWRIRPSELPRKVEMRRAQAYALLAARRVFDPLRGSALYDEIDLGVAKLLAFAERPGRGPNAGRANTALADRFVYLPATERDYAEKAEDIDELFQAVAELRALSVRYRPQAAGREERLRLHPYGLVLHRDRIYCVARDTARKQLGTYALERMRDVSALLEERFELPVGFRVQDHFSGELGPAHPEEGQRVVVELSAVLAKDLSGDRLHPTQQWTSAGGGVARVTFHLRHPESLVPRLLGWGSEARVVEPDSLRETVLERLRAAVAAYQAE